MFERIIVPLGIGYHLTNPIAFKRSDGEVTGIVTAFDYPRVYFRVDSAGPNSGRIAYTDSDLVVERPIES